MSRKGNTLDRFLVPESIAIFGSMQENGFFGASVIIKDLMKWDYKGALYPVHPTADRAHNLDVFRDLGDVNGIPALAVVVTSYRNVPAIMEQCGRKGVKSMIIVSDGFAETGAEGIKREHELTNMARSFGIRVIGPNTVGIFNAADRISTVPYEKGYEYKETGRLSIITQTGMYGPQTALIALRISLPPGQVQMIIDGIKDMSGVYVGVYYGATFFVDMVYFTYFHGASGQTPGKMVFGLRVIQASGQEMTFGVAFLRWVGYLVSSVFIYLGYLWVAFDGKKQGWHDKIAATIVVQTHDEPPRHWAARGKNGSKALSPRPMPKRACSGN